MGAITETTGNPGAVPIAAAYESAAEIVDKHPDPFRRSTGLAGYEGFAMDDAIFDPRREGWERWSFARLAGLVAELGYSRSSSPTILELGCGPGHMMFMLRRYGIQDYLGVDGNPYFIEFNPSLVGFEGHFRLLDLTHKIRLADESGPLTFDVVFSFEVLEHIPEEKLDTMLETARSHMSEGSFLICTASRQEEIDVHVLVRDREWWVGRLAAAGLEPPEPSLAAALGERVAHAHPFNWRAEQTHIFVLVKSATVPG
jgi:SAM-dependent methyltransferase